MEDLKTKRCLPCEGGVPALEPAKVKKLLKEISGWKAREDNKEIQRKFNFKDYYKTMAFVNAVAWISHEENHHPDLEVSYSSCLVRYSTHAIDGLSENDFICAAKVNALIP